jgi:hypothetical protein
MTRSFLALAGLLTGLFTVPTFAGQAPGAAADPDIPISIATGFTPPSSSRTPSR